ncbi:MAG: hydroxyacid dehydrogenase [Planctomycetes bacterium]|nr:hydroxyacid dehydrogenase [Planctomycetota bacterium]
MTIGPDVPVQSASGIHILISGRPSETQLKACGPNLQALVIPWAGLPPETRSLMRQYEHVSVHNLHHNAVPTAEMAVTLYLAAAKMLVPLDQSLRQGDWSPRYAKRNKTVLVHGKTAVILGYGAIGQHVARILHGLGMTVQAVSRSGIAPSGTSTPCSVHHPVSLATLLTTADALFVSVPLTDDTLGLIGQAELELMPSTAIIVNVARGAVIDEAALYDALASKRILAAGLDVWYNYPKSEPERTNTFPSQYPFHELDNVVLSPHRAGAVGADESEQNRWKALTDLLHAAADGRPMPNQVDLELGY